MKKLAFVFILIFGFSFAQTATEFENEITAKIQNEDYADAYQLIFEASKINGNTERLNYLNQATTFYFLSHRLKVAGLKPSMNQIYSAVKSLTIDIDKNTEDKNKLTLFRCFISYSLLYYAEYSQKLSDLDKSKLKQQILNDASIVILNFPDYKQDAENIINKLQ